MALWECKFNTGVLTEGGFFVMDSTTVPAVSSIASPGFNASPYCARFTVPATNPYSYRRASLWKYVNPTTYPTITNAIWMRFYVKLPMNNAFFFTFSDSAAQTRLLWIGVNSSGRWCLMHMSNATGAEVYRTTASTISAPLNEWVLIELYINRTATGEGRLYANGTQVLSWTPLDMAYQGSTHLIISNEPSTTNISGYSIDIDSVAFGDVQVGPETVTLPKITINSSPELNVPVYIDNQFVGNTPVTQEVTPGTHEVRVEQEVDR